MFPGWVSVGSGTKEEEGQTSISQPNSKPAMLIPWSFVNIHSISGTKKD